MIDFLFGEGSADARQLTNNLGGDPSELVGFVVFGGLCMFYMAWGIGANDCANNFATTWASGALTLKQCVLIAGVCEFCGAIFLGSNVTKTFRKGMVDIKMFDGEDGRTLIVVGMTAVLFSAASWLLLASTFGLPVSTTHSAVGGVIAFGVISKGYSCVMWDKVGMIVASWFISPVLSGVFSFCVFYALKHNVLSAGTQRSFDLTLKVAPAITFIMMFVIVLFVFYKGAKGIGLNKTDPGVAVGIAFGIAAVFAGMSIPVAKNIKEKLDRQEAENQLNNVEGGAADNSAPGNSGDSANNNNDIELKIDSKTKEEETSNTDSQELKQATMSKTERLWCGFCWVTASFQALAHGGNDVANSVGPYAAVIAAHEGDVSKKADVPFWVFVVAGVGIIAGLAMYSKNVMTTIGKDVTQMQPSKAFSAELSATTVILIATAIGIPISTTHASVGAVIGSGVVDDGFKGLNWKTLGKVFTSWVVTLPIVGIGAAGLYGFMLPIAVETPIV